MQLSRSRRILAALACAAALGGAACGGGSTPATNSGNSSTDAGGGEPADYVPAPSDSVVGDAVDESGMGPLQGVSLEVHKDPG